jgi:hypothetical protein
MRFGQLSTSECASIQNDLTKCSPKRRADSLDCLGDDATEWSLQAFCASEALHPSQILATTGRKVRL